MNKNLSNRINVLRYPLIIGILFIHSHSVGISLTNMKIIPANNITISNFIINLLSQGIARISVPLFFLIASYLFFLNYSLTFNVYFSKIKKRVKSLMIPLIFWNILIIILFFIAQKNSYFLVYFTDKSNFISKFSFFDYLNAIFGITRHPIQYPFWFIRDLLVLFFLSPPIYWLIKKIPFFVLLVTMILWLFNIIKFPYLSFESLFFFVLGAFLVVKKYSFDTIDNYGKLFGIVYLFLLLLDVFTKTLVFNYTLHKIGILFGIFSVYYLSGKSLYFNKLKDILMFLAPSSFFVFASHEPLLTVIRKISFSILKPNNNFLLLFLYFFNIFLVLSVCTISYYVFKRYFPKITSIITGGR